MADKKTARGPNWLIRVVSSNWFRGFIIVWFLFQASYMAVSTRLGISPDELYHYSLIKVFAKNGWLPFIHSQFGDYTAGDAVHNAFFLYHYLLSLPFHFFSGSGHAYIYLRFINLAIVLISFYFIIRLANRFRASALVTNLSLFMLANTLMFVFLSGMINYDSLLMLLGLASFDLLFSLLEKPRARKGMALLVVWLAGLMTVINFYPIVFVELVLLIFKYRKNLGPAFHAIQSSWKQSSNFNLFFAVLAVLLLGLFIQRPAANVIRFHALSPSCNSALSVSKCKEAYTYVDNQRINSIHPAAPVQSAITYIGTWLSDMKSRTFGIFGHKYFNETKLIGWWVYIFVFLGLAALARLYNSKDRKATIIFGIFIFYTLFLYYDDYKYYHHTGIFGAAVQGRYWFVFLPLIYIIFNRYISQLFQKRYLINSYIVITLLIFLTAGLPSYLIKTDPTWYTAKTAKFNVKVHNKLNSIYHNL